MSLTLRLFLKLREKQPKIIEVLSLPESQRAHFISHPLWRFSVRAAAQVTPC